MPPPPVRTTTPIYDVQGSGASSPLDGSAVSIVGIVTGDFQDDDGDPRNDLGGFFVQEEAADADPGTSDGIFVFDRGASAPDVDLGDRVTVDGTVVENFGETQIDAASVSVTGTGTISPTTLPLPAAATTANSDGETIADLEAWEGMLVTIPGDLFVTELFNLERYGEVLLSAGNRLQQFTSTAAPDPAGYDRHLREIAMRSIVLDDGLVTQNPARVRYLFPDPVATPDYSVRAGDAVSDLTGTLRYSRGSGASGRETWRLVPTADPDFTSINPRPAGVMDPGGTMRVASFNVLNFFTTIDTGQNICGPSGDLGCRGADSVEEFDRQRAKIIGALALLDADIVGLIELENNGGTALQSIVDGLNALGGAGSWSSVNTGFVGSDAIVVGFIYKTASVTPQGAFAVLDSSLDPRFDDARNRPALAQTFRDTTGETLTLVVNHLKSKGSPCDVDGDPDLNDGQGNCNRTRTNAVLALVDWLATDPTGSGDADFLVIGDMNAYLEEDPVRAFEDAGYVNLLRAQVGPGAYSFLFRGQVGALDHAFASPALAPRVSGALEWHINADEPPALDYNLDFGRDPALFDATLPIRASDHDPVVIGLDP